MVFLRSLRKKKRFRNKSRNKNGRKMRGGVPGDEVMANVFTVFLDKSHGDDANSDYPTKETRLVTLAFYDDNDIKRVEIKWQSRNRMTKLLKNPRILTGLYADFIYNAETPYFFEFKGYKFYRIATQQENALIKKNPNIIPNVIKFETLISGVSDLKTLLNNQNPSKDHLKNFKPNVQSIKVQVMDNFFSPGKSQREISGVPLDPEESQNLSEAMRVHDTPALHPTVSKNADKFSKQQTPGGLLSILRSRTTRRGGRRKTKKSKKYKKSKKSRHHHKRTRHL